MEHLADNKMYQEIPYDYTQSLTRRTNTLIKGLKQLDTWDSSLAKIDKYFLAGFFLTNIWTQQTPVKN